jgi:hypothetical protein
MLIPVRPKNYRSIALAAIALATDPVVLMNRRRISDYSTLARPRARNCVTKNGSPAPTSV